MGIIRKILVVFFLTFTCGLSAQTVSDTVIFDGEVYVKHMVQVGESVKSIAELHKVKTSDILENNEIHKRLFYHQLLYIPVYLTNIQKEEILENEAFLKDQIKSDASIINIALLLPYYLLKNDTMFNQYEDTAEIPNIYYNKSEAALSFHVGVELAIDSLRKAGKKIILHAFDTNQDSLQVRKIVGSNQLDGMDIIIGPMYSKFFQMICKRYGKNTNKTLISPLSRNNKGIKKYPAVYQLALSYKVQADILTNYLKKKKLRDRIIILHDKKEKALSTYVQRKFDKENKTVKSFQVEHTKVDSIRRFFVDRQHVLLLSSNKVFISKMLGSIGGIDSVSVVYAFESVTSYDNLDITNLMELDVHVPNSRGVNHANEFDQNFIELFEREYNTNVRKYTNIGYNIIMQFCGNANIYAFKRLKRGYSENILAPIYHYSDYELVPVD